MGGIIRFKSSCKLFNGLGWLAILVGLTCELTHEIITNAWHVITTQKIAGGTTTVAVGFPIPQVRSEEYPVYCQISDLGHARILSKPTLIAKDIPLAETCPILTAKGKMVYIIPKLRGLWRLGFGSYGYERR